MTEGAVLVHLAIIGGYGFLSHALIMLDDGLHWDGWILDSWQRNQSWPVMRRVYSEVGLSPLYYMHRALAGVPNRIFVYRLITFGCTLATASAIYFLGPQAGFLNEFQSLLLALLYLSYTGYHMNVDTVVGIQYTVPTALFYWACYIALMSADSTGVSHWSLRAAALSMFMLAFNANSTLVYYFGFLGLKFFLHWDPALGAGANSYRALTGNIDYVALPFLYWFLKNILTPRHGHYADYNRIRLHPSTLALRLLDATRFGFEASITLPIVSAISKHYLWIPAAASAWMSWIAFDAFAGAAVIPSHSAIALVCVGFALFILAALPYALVNQLFFPGGWATKHHMLFHLPVALIVLGTTALVSSPGVTLFVIGFILLINAIHLNLTYLHHIGVAVKNRSWLYKLSRIEGARTNSVFLITDRHSLQGDAFNQDQEHRPAYLFYMFEWLWGDKTRIGIPVNESCAGAIAVDQVSQELIRSTFEYDMQEVNVRGAQARVIISDGPLRPPSMIPLFYLRRRCLRGAKVEEVLELATELKYTAL
jgi:hypothetical protein